MARDVQITFDCADPAALAAFWAEALGYRLQDPPQGFESWERALEAMGMPPQSRNDASAVVGPRARDRSCSSIGCAGAQAGGDARMAVLPAEAERLVSQGRHLAPAPRAVSTARRRSHP